MPRRKRAKEGNDAVPGGRERRRYLAVANRLAVEKGRHFGGRYACAVVGISLGEGALRPQVELGLGVIALLRLQRDEPRRKFIGSQFAVSIAIIIGEFLVDEAVRNMELAISRPLF